MHFLHNFKEFFGRLKEPQVPFLYDINSLIFFNILHMSQIEIKKVYNTIFPGNGQVVGDFKSLEKCFPEWKAKITLESIYKFIFKEIGQPASFSDVELYTSDTDFYKEFKNKVLVYFSYTPYYASRWDSVELWDIYEWKYVKKHFDDKIALHDINGKHSEELLSVPEIYSCEITDEFTIAKKLKKIISPDTTVYDQVQEECSEIFQVLGHVLIKYKFNNCTGLELVPKNVFQHAKDNPNLAIDVGEDDDHNIACSFQQLQIEKIYRNPNNILKHQDDIELIEIEFFSAYEEMYLAVL
jgi:hypothetical protein